MPFGSLNFIQRRVKNPWQFTLHEYWQITQRVLVQLNKDNVAVVGAGVAFFSLLSLFPMISAGLSIYGYFADLSDVQVMANRVSAILPPDAWAIISAQIADVVSAPNSELSIRIILSLLFGLYAAGAGIRALLRAMNVAYNETETRNPVLFFLTAVGMTLGLFVFTYLSLVLIVGVPAALAFLNLDETAQQIARYLPWIILVILFGFGAGVIYRFGPDRRPPRKRWVMPGVIFTTLSWLMISWAFQYFVKTFGSYQATYGSLSAVIVLLLWFWLTAMTVIVGAEINAEMERQTTEDTTRGPFRPVGLRQSKVADFLSLIMRRRYGHQFPHALSTQKQDEPIDPSAPTLIDLEDADSEPKQTD